MFKKEPYVFLYWFVGAFQKNVKHCLDFSFVFSAPLPA
jgi:hypothetical protein